MSDMTKQAVSNGVHHIGLTVPDPEQTRVFFPVRHMICSIPSGIRVEFLAQSA